jgi:thymidylate synthase ThyX
MTVLRTYQYENFILEMVSLPCSTVEFIDGMQNPMSTLAKLSAGYRGIYENIEPTDKEIEQAIKDMNSTKLNTPLEMLETVWLVKGVTRAFTHQAVRTRIGASFVQESMRFLGHKGIYQVLALGGAKDNLEAFDIYAEAASHDIVAYEKLLYLGVSSEDARGILPTNILTAVYVGYAMSSLRLVYTQRMCCQAQPGEWQHVMKQMKHLLTLQYGAQAHSMLSAPYERGIPCGYRASFDRPCEWQKEN